MPSRPLTDEEIKSISHALKSERDRCLFILGVRTGFRISELLSIKLEDVLQYGEMRDSITVKRSHMKGKHGSRTVPIHREAKEALGKYIPTLPKGSIRLFPFTRMTAHRIIRRVCEELEIGGKVSSHSCRKAFGMKIYKITGKDIVATQRALGHKSLSSTTHYLSVGQEVVDKAILGD